MLDDRPYMQSSYQATRRHPSVMLLIGISVGVFLLQALTRTPGFPSVWDHYFYLSQTGVGRGFLWQFISFQFIHANLLHLLFNGWALYVFGRMIEETLGKDGFLSLFFMSGALGGLLHLLIAWSTSGMEVPQYMIGASAGIYGLIAVFARLWPDSPMMLFPFPVTLRVRHFFFILLAIAGVGLLFSGAGQVSHAGHFGGAIGGLLYAHYFMGRRTPVFAAKQTVRPREFKAAKVRGVARVFAQKANRPARPAEMSREEFISREIDPILEKISAHGMHSLTEKERQLLESARSKLDGRSR
ncbi:MAG: rhomboid family intramembrane serine protease [Verrucomicrobia bacterium]|nr:rhomboid family intramembrane serine protease [Verrucomicrobiota bacterium]